eukprot:CAMPEP_0179447976 /NCGR_PEP_ID=MMETSP0799-20121207/31769_1 /TAXON_ID=46947 /ORGANISM="Geminigera cryophila, Strain CCMP2564" /LENGTH=483 /DNA_ID=CAMNT_0021239251 /DNA_START=217 /DNA_END=1669 /DNA_ORIENTATION=-
MQPIAAASSGGGAEDNGSDLPKRAMSIENIISGISLKSKKFASGVYQIPSKVFNRTNTHDTSMAVSEKGASSPSANAMAAAAAATSAEAQRVAAEKEEDANDLIELQGLTPKEAWKLKKKRKSWPVRQRLWASFTDVCTALAALEQAPGTLMKSKDDEKALFLQSLWHGFCPVMSYACCSIYMVISQAYVLRHKRSAGINYSTLLLMYQNICGLALYFAEDVLGRQPFPFFDFKSAMLMLPNSALFAIMVYSSTRAIKHLAVPMISVFRNFAPITITLVEWLWMKERKPNNGVLFSMALLIVGAMIAAVNDLAFTVEGYLWMLTNVVSNVAHLIVLRKLKLNRDLSNMQILHYSALWSLIWLIPVGLYEDIWGSWLHLFKMPLTFKLVLASTGINSVLMFLATVWCLERVSGSTYSMVGALNKIPIAIIGFAFFNSPTTKMGLLGVSIGLLGGIVFTLAKLNEMKEAIRRSAQRKDARAKANQ